MSLLTPAEVEGAKRQAVQLAKAQILAALDPEDLITLELDEAARYLRVSSKTAARLLPVATLGPRIQRVDLRAFQDLKRLCTIPPDAGVLAAYLKKYGTLLSPRASAGEH